MQSTAPRHAATLLTAFAFLLSGASALVYQVAWQRILALASGIGIYSIAMIVAAFMGGLGLGSALGGLLSVRVSRPRALAAFALLELGIGAFGALSCFFYYDGLYRRGGWLYDDSLRTGLAHFLSLLLPTSLMGMSLPFLTRAMVKDAPGAGRTIGALYGINLLGAALGAVATPWWLIRYLGLEGATQVAAIGNGLAGVVALLAARLRRQEGERTGPGSLDPRPSSEPRPFGLWLTLYGLSGFCALALEMLWFRMVDVMEKSSAFTFGTILSVYLLGSALGTFAVLRRLDRLRRPLRAFLLCQCALLAYAGAAVWLLARLPPDTPGYLRLYLQFGKAMHISPPGRDDLVLLFMVVPLLLFGPPTVLMGASFPILQRAVQDEAERSSLKVGLLQAANILGCILGSLLVGLVLLDRLGTSGSLRLLLAIGLGFAALGLRTHGPLFLVPGAVLAGLLVALPGQDALWWRLHAASPRARVVEDATGVAVLKPLGRTAWSLWVHGKRNSDLPYGGLHTALGAIPAVMHEAPEDVAIIGLGLGDTAWAAGCRETTRRITVFEIVRPEFALVESILRDPQPYGKLQRLFTDPRYTMSTEDGRNALERSEHLWDVIEMDAFYPTAAGAGSLYSVEFFSNLLRKLKPGGLVSTWSPTPRTHASFCRAFPHVVDFGGGKILLGSNQRIRLDMPTWTARLLSPAVRSYLGFRPADEVRGLLETAAPAAAHVRPGDLNHDLFPRDEFATPQERPPQGR